MPIHAAIAFRLQTWVLTELLAPSQPAEPLELASGGWAGYGQVVRMIRAGWVGGLKLNTLNLEMGDPSHGGQSLLGLRAWHPAEPKKQFLLSECKWMREILLGHRAWGQIGTTL